MENFSSAKAAVIYRQACLYTEASSALSTQYTGWEFSSDILTRNSDGNKKQVCHNPSAKGYDQVFALSHFSTPLKTAADDHLPLLERSTVSRLSM